MFDGRYRIVRCIRAGGMGAVYEAIHIETGRRRALKVMLPKIVQDENLRARFKLEARVTADIVSEHIVETFDAGIEPQTGAPFLVMELLQGEDLGATMEKRRLEPSEVVVLLSQAAFALDKTHAAGIVHRDLKPDNLFLTHRDDGSPRLKILDFGIAKVVAQSNAKSTMVGTPLFMAPEQIQGDATLGPRADLYALGHIAYALLAGEPYWLEATEGQESLMPLFTKALQGAKEPAVARAKRRRNVTLRAAFDPWFAKATALAPGHRFESAGEMVGELARVLGVVVERFSLSAREVESPGQTLKIDPLQGGISNHAAGHPRAISTAPSPPMERAPSQAPAAEARPSHPATMQSEPGIAPRHVTSASPAARTTSPIASDTSPSTAPKAKRASPMLTIGILGVLTLGGAASALKVFVLKGDRAGSASSAMAPVMTSATAPNMAATITVKPAEPVVAQDASTQPSPATSASAPPIAHLPRPAATPTSGRPTDCTWRPWNIDSAGHKTARLECQ